MARLTAEERALLARLAEDDDDDDEEEHDEFVYQGRTYRRVDEDPEPEPEPRKATGRKATGRKAQPAPPADPPAGRRRNFVT